MKTTKRYPMAEPDDDVVLDYARGLTDSLDPQIRSLLLLLYPHRDKPVWLRIVPYVQDDGRLSPDGILLAHACCVLDERSSVEERNEAAQALWESFATEFRDCADMIV